MNFLPLPEEIKERLENSRRWRETEGKQGARLYLAFEQLDHLDFENAMMFESTLQEANLAGSRLDGAELGRSLANGLCLDDSQCIATHFDKAELVEASLMRAIARLATFRKSNLTGARFDQTDLREADFERAKCNEASFRNADLRGARMTGALLMGADFTRALMSGIDLSGAVLDSTTRLAPADGTDGIVAEYLHIDGRVIRDSEVRTGLAALAAR